MFTDGLWLDNSEMEPQQCDGDQLVQEDHNYSKKIIYEETEEVNQNNSGPDHSDVMSIKRMELLFKLKPAEEDFFASIIPVKKKPLSAADLLKSVVNFLQDQYQNFLKTLYLQNSRKSISFEPSDGTYGVETNKLKSRMMKRHGVNSNEVATNQPTSSGRDRGTGSPPVSTSERVYLDAMAQPSEVPANPETSSKNRLKGFECKLCSQKFSREVAMKDHLKDQHGLKNAFACLICNVMFATPMRMRVHLQNFHETFSCGWCSKSFSRRFNLNEHEKKRHDKTSLKHRCKVCGKGLSSAGFLRRHVRNYHKGVNPDEVVEEPVIMNGVRIKTELAADAREKGNAKKARAFKIRVKMEPAKKAAALKPTAKKAVVKKTSAKEATAKKAVVKDAATKKVAVEETSVKDAAVRKEAEKITSAKEVSIKREPGTETPAKKTPAKKAAAIKKTSAKKRSVEKDPDNTSELGEEACRSRSNNSGSVEGFECDSCPASFELKSELNWHKMTDHRPEAESSTNLAKKIKVEQGVDDSIDKAIRQMALISPRAADKDFKCDSCPKIFASQNYLDKHKKSAHHSSSDSTMLKMTPPTSEIKILKCDECCKFFVLQSSFDDHVRYEHQQHSSLKIGNVQTLTNEAFESSELGDSDSSISNLTMTEPDSDRDNSTESVEESPSPKRGKAVRVKDSTKAVAKSRKRKEKKVLEDGPKSKKSYYVSVRSENGFSCQVCSKIFHHKGFYLKHLRLVHQIVADDQDDSTQVTAADPGPSSLDESELILVDDPISLTSDQADMTEESPSAVRSVLPRVKFENLSDSIKCLTCNKSFKSNNDLVRHMQEAHVDPLSRTKSDSVAMSCGFCPQTFESSQEVVQHIKSSHQHRVPPADSTLAVINYTDEAQTDPLKDNDAGSSIFVCVVCKKIFVSHAALEKHTKAAHRNVKPMVPSKPKASRFTLQAIKKPTITLGKKSVSSPADPLDSGSDHATAFTDVEASGSSTTIDMSKMKLVDPLAIIQQGLEEINKTLDGQGSDPKPKAKQGSKRQAKIPKLEPTEFVVFHV